jgi:hypothetical protein
MLLKEKVDLVLAKGQTPLEGRWNNTDHKVMIQWYKRDGDKALPRKKDGLFLRYREKHTRVPDTKKSATTTETTTIVTRAMACPVAVGPNPKHISALAPTLIDWGIDEAPFDVGIHLDMDAPARPLYHVDCENDDSSSDDDSIFVHLSRD